MMRKTLRITMPYVTMEDSDEWLVDYIFSKLNRYHFTYEFWHSLIPPHKSVFIFPGLNALQIKNTIQNFQEWGMKMPEEERKYCKTEISDFEDEQEGKEEQ